MNYFTVERYLRLQDTTDSAAWMSAHEDWERAVKGYWEGVSRMLDRLPEDQRFADLRRFLQGSLHDAVVLASWAARDRLTLVVQPERPETDLVILEYGLAEPPDAVRDEKLSDFAAGTVTVEWEYDELELAAASASACDDPVFTHRILLSSGVELTVRFMRFKMTRVPPLSLAWSPPAAARKPELSQTG